MLTSGPNNETQGAYKFSGNWDSYIEFPRDDGILDVKYSITLMCWVRPGGQDGPLFNYRTDGVDGVRIWINLGGSFYNKIEFKNSEVPSTHGMSTNQPLTVGKWVHVAATYDHTTGDNSIYIDGVFNKSEKLPKSDQISTNHDKVRMGAVDGGNRYFNGSITQMRVYNVSLSGQQILAVKNQGKS